MPAQGLAILLSLLEGWVDIEQFWFNLGNFRLILGWFWASCFWMSFDFGMSTSYLAKKEDVFQFLISTLHSWLHLQFFSLGQSLLHHLRLNNIVGSGHQVDHPCIIIKNVSKTLNKMIMVKLENQRTTRWRCNELPADLVSSNFLLFF